MHESLRRYWPPEGQILLLKAALTDLATARQAWRQWDARQELADAASPEVGLLAAVAITNQSGAHEKARSVCR